MKTFFSFALTLTLLAGSLDASKPPPAPLEIRLGLAIPLSGGIRGIRSSLWHPLRLSLPGLDRTPAISYTGRVVDRTTGRPVAGARVWPGVDPEASVTTDAGGAFRLAWTPGVPAQLWVRAEGYFPFSGAFRPPVPWIVSPKAPTLALLPARTLEGVVVRPDGQPVPEAEVRVFGQSRYDELGIMEAGEIQRARSSPQGRFRFAVIHDGNYEVVGVSPGLAAGSESVTLVAGQARVSDIRLVLRQGRTGRGRVLDENGGPVAEARVEMKRNTDDGLRPGGSPADDGLHQATTDGEGQFEIPALPAGCFDLEVSRPGFLPGRLQALEVEGGSGSADLGTVTLRQPAMVTGWVTGQNREPLAGVTVRLRSGEGEAVSGPDGRFELTAPDNPRKPFEIEVCRPPDRGTLIQSYATVPDKPVELTLPTGVRLTGRVVDPDGQPAAGATVSTDLLPGWGGSPSSSPCPSTFDIEATTDAEGRFVMGPMAGGSRLYVLRARMSGYVQSDAVTVTVGDSPEMDVPVLALQRASAVSGRILKADGSPAPQAKVFLGGADMWLSPRSVRADGDGRYRLDGLATGAQIIEARHETLGGGERKIEIAPGENQLDITLKAELLARGRVLDPDGAPAAGARVETMDEAVFTDARGTFAIPVDEDGYELVARKAGYAPAYLNHWAVEGALEGLELRLGPEASISGRLLGLDPAGIGKATVLATSLLHGEMRIPGRVSSDGTYRIQGLVPGEWSVRARIGERAVDATFTISPDEPEVVQDLSFPDRTEVRGRLVDAAGKPAWTDVVLVSPDEEHGKMADGAFSLKVKDGTYEILAGGNNGYGLTRGGFVTVAGEPVEGLEIRLEPATVLTGRLLGVAAKDLEVSLVWIDLGLFRHRADLEIDENSGEPPVYRVDLGPGDWTLRARVNSKEIVRRVTVRPGDPTIEMDLPFSFGELTLSGRLTGYRALGEGHVWLKEVGSDLDWMRSIDGGTFIYPRLHPGRYLLTVADDRGTTVLQREIDLTSSQELEIDLGSLEP